MESKQESWKTDGDIVNQNKYSINYVVVLYMYIYLRNKETQQTKN